MNHPTILILGGTTEAAELARRLASLPVRVITSLAGRTRDPAKLAGEVRSGGFGGAEGLAGYIQAEDVTIVVDATHPFATRISPNAAKAAKLAGRPLIRLERPAWQKTEGDDWHEVASLEEAASAIPPSARVLLALGRQHIAVFSSRPGVHFVVRMIDPPETPLGLASHQLVLARPGKAEDEEAFLQDRRITHIVCRNSGGTASYAKLEAARNLKIPVILIARPPQVHTNAVGDVDAVLEFVRTSLEQPLSNPSFSGLSRESTNG
ncbi:cobalt-precorrin-6X reductase [Paramesorhizobium deserti]|uniref:Cobalt-precorrin-6X reductase n=1 Tax=Paramesorhizobium deserti TaxID=1494590 RepID=A0A135HUP8_9HYPH|nr:cobalt-precorrin-6A reductase [Paramesorhizobium deserti]KXF76926.1 cobalt-precorrin-6X reductase [Paramesorhizobium deserti]